MRTALKQFRIGKKLKQDEFAERIGVSRATYSAVERGERGGDVELFWKAIQREFNVLDEEMWKLQKSDE